MRPLSNDLRERVVSAVGAGDSCRSVAERFGVAASTVMKWSQRYRATGSVASGKVGGHRKPVLNAHRAFIRERIDQTPHLTLHKLKDELAVRGVVVSHNAVWTFLRREGLSFKKTLFALEQARADVARRRRRWQALQAGLDPKRLVFIDETWIKTNMVPLRGWAPKGQRLRGFAPQGRWRTQTFLGAQAAIEAFDEGILLRLARFDVVPVEATALGPAEHRQAVELGAVVLSGKPSPRYHGLQLADHPTARQRGVGHQAQLLPRVVVDHRQDPEPAAVTQRVVHEVHRQALVRSWCRNQRNTRHRSVLASDAPADLQPFLDIQPTQSLEHRA
jgi:transposase